MYCKILIGICASLIVNKSHAQLTSAIEHITVAVERNLISSDQNDINQINLDELHFKPSKISDALAQLPGVSLNGQGGMWQTYVIRGFSRWRILSKVANVPINTERRAGSALSFIDPSLVAGIAVNKGASSTFYGSGALGGVVDLNFKLDEPTRFSLSQSSFANEKAFSMTGSDDNLSFGIAYRQAQNEKDLNNNPLLSQFKQASSFINWQHELSNDLLINYLFVASDASDIGKSNNQYPNKKITLYPDALHIINKLALSDYDNWSIASYSHYQKWQNKVTRVNKRCNLVDYKSHDWGFMGQKNWQFDSFNGRIGLDIDQRDNVKVEEEQYNLDNELDWEKNNLSAKQSAYAGYIDANLVFDAVAINMGSRIDYYNQSSKSILKADHKVTGFISLNKVVNKEWLLSAKVASGFRYPSLTERYFDGTTGRGKVLGNPELSPEKVLNTELNLKADFSDISWEFSIFNSQIDDYIERVTVADELFSYQNITQGVIYGFEQRLALQLNPSIKLIWQFQWQQGRTQEKLNLADISPAEHDLTLTHQANSYKMSLKYRYRLAKSDISTSEQVLEKAHIFSIRADSYLGDNIQISLAIENIFNENYLTTADELANLMPGRHINLSLSYTL